MNALVLISPESIELGEESLFFSWIKTRTIGDPACSRLGLPDERTLKDDGICA